MNSYQTIDQIAEIYKNNLSSSPNLLTLLSTLSAAGNLSGHAEDKFLVRYFPKTGHRYSLDLEAIHSNLSNYGSINKPANMLNRYMIDLLSSDNHLKIITNEVQVPYTILSFGHIRKDAIEALDNFFEKVKGSAIKQWSILSNFHRIPPDEFSMEVFE